MNTRAIVGIGVAVAIVVAAAWIWRYEQSVGETALSAAKTVPVPIVVDPLEARVDSGKVTLIGPVPDEETRQSLLAEAKKRFGADQVVDALSVNPDLSGFMWYHSEAIYLPLVARGLDRGVGRFDGTRLTLDGFATNADARTDVETAANVAVNGRFAVTSRVQLPEAATVAAGSPAAASTVARAMSAKALQEKLDRFFDDKSIEFEATGTRLTYRSLAVLDQLAAMLAMGDARIEVSGHTDNRGDAEQNVRLSRLRAEEVCSYLARRGVAPDRLLAHGYGAARAVAIVAGAPPEVSKSRYIEIRVLEGR